MKKIIFLISFLILTYVGFAQSYRGYVIEGFQRLEAKRAFVLGGDSVYATTQINSNDTTLVTKEYLKFDILKDVLINSKIGQAGNLVVVTEDENHLTYKNPNEIFVQTTNTIIVEQEAHGFSLGDWIRFDGVDYLLANADTLITADVVGIIDSIYSVDSFSYRYDGIYTKGTWELGANYYLSAATDGIATTADTFAVNQVRVFLGTGIKEGLLLEIDVGFVLQPTVEFVEGDPLYVADSANIIYWTDIDSLVTLLDSILQDTTINADLSYVAFPDKGEVRITIGDSAIITLVDGTNAGLMSPADKAKLDSLTVAIQLYFNETILGNGTILNPYGVDTGLIATITKVQELISDSLADVVITELDPVFEAEKIAILDSLTAHNNRLLVIESIMPVFSDTLTEHNNRLLVLENITPIDTTGLYHINRAILDAITATDISNWNTDLVDDADNDPTNELQDTTNIPGLLQYIQNHSIAVETDPTFTTSPASDLTETDISNIQNILTLIGGTGGKPKFKDGVVTGRNINVNLTGYAPSDYDMLHVLPDDSIAFGDTIKLSINYGEAFPIYNYYEHDVDYALELVYRDSFWFVLMGKGQENFAKNRNTGDQIITLSNDTVYLTGSDSVSYVVLTVGTGGGNQNLTYATYADKGIMNISGGTGDTIPSATSLIAGLMTPSDKDTIQAHNERLLVLENNSDVVDTLTAHNERLLELESITPIISDTLTEHNVRLIALELIIPIINDTLTEHNSRLLALENMELPDTTGIYHANRALLDAIDVTDTTRWGVVVDLSGYIEFSDTVTTIATKADIVGHENNVNTVLSNNVFGADNRLIRSDGTERNVQYSGITISDTDDYLSIGDIANNGTFRINPAFTNNEFNFLSNGTGGFKIVTNSTGAFQVFAGGGSTPSLSINPTTIQFRDLIGTGNRLVVANADGFITATKKDSTAFWNIAYSWGNHDGLYVETEADPTVSDLVKSIDATDTTRWGIKSAITYTIPETNVSGRIISATLPNFTPVDGNVIQLILDSDIAEGDTIKLSVNGGDSLAILDYYTHDEDYLLELVYLTDYWGLLGRKSEEYTSTGTEIKSVSISDPTASENVTVFYAPMPLTITNIYAVVVGSSTPSVTINPIQTTDRSATGTAILSSPTAITNTTTGQNLTTFNDATIDAGTFIVLKTTAQSGTVNELHVTINYKLN